MSTVVDERVVSMRFDNKQFESNVQTSMSTLDKLKQSLNLTGASKGLENVSAAAKNVNLTPLSSAVQTVHAKFSALEIMAITTLQNITNTAVNAGKKIVSALTIDPIKTGFSEYETQINAIQTILANTQSKGTTLDDVNGALDELNAYADKTIYNFTEMTKNIGTFTAAGVDLDTSVSAIKGIANLAAVSGSTSQQASTAMYQLSQALSSGTVKLQDWNSVVNAGMGGQVFQDALKETARVHGIQIDKMIENEGSFRETLKNGWLTSGILTETLSKFTGDLNEEQLKTMGYTEEQIESIIKMGQTANDAATKVKTFTQLFDTLKEAAQSGWTQTWEIIVGDFEEAKELLTEVSDVFGEIINASSNARNEMLQGWKDLGGRTVLIEGVRNAFEGILSIIKPIKEAFREIFPPLTSQQLYDFTVALKNLTAKLKLSDEQSDNLKRTFKGLFAILDIVKQAFVAVWNWVSPLAGGMGELGNNVLATTASWGDWLVNLSNTIRETDAFGKALQTVTDFFKKVITFVKEDAVPAIVSFKDSVSDLVTTVISKVQQVVTPAVSAIKGFIDSVKENFKMPGFEAFQAMLERVKTRTEHNGGVIVTVIEGVIKAFGFLVGGLAAVAKTIKNGIVKAFDAIEERIANSKFLQFFVAIFKGVTTIAKGIASAVGDMAGNIVEQIGNADFDTIFDIISGLSVGGIALAIKNFIDSTSKPIKDFGSIFDGLKGILKSVTGILDSVRGCFEAYQTQLKANTLLTIASAIAILAAAIIAISLVDSVKLAASLGAVTALFGELMASMAIFTKISGSMSKATQACTTMIAMSVAILLLSVALKSISELNWEELGKGLTGVAALATVLVASAKTMSSGSGKLVKGAGSLIIFAAAIKILASVCEDISSLSWEELGKGLTGVGVLLAEVSIFLNTAKFSSKATSTATGMLIMSAAIKVLASACKDLSSLSWEELAKGLVAVGALLAEVSLFLNTAKFSGKAISTATGMVILGAAIKILASACQTFAGMSWEEIAKGLTSVGILLAELAIFTNLTGNAKHVISTGAALVIIGAAMKIFASAVSDFASMSWEELAKGLVAMGVALAEVAIAVNLMPKNIVGVGTGLVIVGAALEIVADVLNKLGGMSWDGVAKGLVVLAGSLGVLAIALNLMNGTLGGSAALLIASSALAILAPMLRLLGNMSWEEIIKSLIALAGAFTILGVAGAVLGPLTPAILGLAGAMALIGVAALGIGAGLVLAGAGLSALAVGFTALATSVAAGATAIVAGLTVIIVGIADLIPVVISKIGEGLIAFCQVIIDYAPIVCEAAVVIITALVKTLVECVPLIVDGVVSILANVLTTIAEYAPTIIEAVVTILLSLVQTLAEHIPEFVSAGMDIIFGLINGFAQKLPDIIQAMIDILMACLKGIADNISQVVQTGIDIVLGFIDGIAKKLPDVIQAGFNLLLSLINGITDAINTNTPLLVDAMKGLVLALVDAGITVLTGGIDLFKEAGKKIMDSGLIQSIKDAFEDAKQAIKDLIDNAKEAITGKVKEWTTAGKNLIEGFISGIKEKASSVVNAAKGVVSDALEGAKKLLGIHSPSKEFAKIGRYSDEGIIVGLKSYAGKVADAAGDVGKGAVSAMTDVISGISDSINNEMDSEPTIRPVLDLSNVESGSRRINAMFSRAQAMTVNAEMNRSGSSNGSEDETSSSKGNTYQFTQNNYSPKALSRVEIYRQTKNQFSAMERMVEG